MLNRSGSHAKYVFPVVLIACVVLSAIILTKGQHLVDSTAEIINSIEKEIESKKQQNAELRDEIAKMNTRAYIEKVARDVLKLARPDETIYEFKEQAEDTRK